METELQEKMKSVSIQRNNLHKQIRELNAKIVVLDKEYKMLIKQYDTIVEPECTYCGRPGARLCDEC